MQATATSNKSNIINPNISIIKFTTDREGACDPSKVSNRWPATILAANRIAKVAGRIILLTVSIITITGIKNLGVPTGTKWAIILFHWKTIDIPILPNHSGRASLKVIDKCLVDVKMYGINPIKLEKIMKKNKEIKIKILPGSIFLLNTASSSLERYNMILM